MRSDLIRNQHLVLRLAIFMIGISTIIEISLRQLAGQSLLVILYMSAEPVLYRTLVFSLRKLITWFAAYWLFTLLFKVEFPTAMIFSLKIVYLVMLTVVVWASADTARMWAELSKVRRIKALLPFFSYILATYLFLKEYLKLFRTTDTSGGVFATIEHAIDTGKQLHEYSSEIRIKVNRLMHQQSAHTVLCHRANLYGMLFLCLLGIVYSI